MNTSRKLPTLFVGARLVFYSAFASAILVARRTLCGIGMTFPSQLSWNAQRTAGTKFNDSCVYTNEENEKNFISPLSTLSLPRQAKEANTHTHTFQNWYVIYPFLFTCLEISYSPFLVLKRRSFLFSNWWEFTEGKKSLFFLFFHCFVKTKLNMGSTFNQSYLCKLVWFRFFGRIIERYIIIQDYKSESIIVN